MIGITIGKFASRKLASHKLGAKLLLTVLLAAGAVQSQTQTLTMDQAAAIARERHGGKVVSVQPAERDGRPAYSVRILQRSGKVVTVIIDAEQRREQADE